MERTITAINRTKNDAIQSLDCHHCISAIGTVEYFYYEPLENIIAWFPEKRLIHIHFGKPAWNDAITLEESEELLMLEKKIIINSDGDKELNIQPKYSNFVILNRGIPKPKTLSHDYYGKFFDLLQLMTIKNNNLKHNNQHPYKKKDICEHLGVKTERALEIFFKALREHNMIAVTNSSDHKFITLNPAYVNMSIKLTEDTYRFFKSDLDKILTPLEIKYFQLLNLDSPVIVMEE